MAEKKKDRVEEPVFAEVFSDQPVATAEGLAFEFEGLATTLAELAWNPRNKTPFTVVVRGDWGRGKTTLMKQVQRLLRDETPASSVRKVRSVWFNAWKYPSDETVLAGLLGALLDELRTDGIKGQLTYEIGKRKDQVARMVLKTAAPWLDLGEGAGRYSNAEKNRAFHDAFRRLFAQALYAWQKPTTAVRDLDNMPVEDLLKARQEDHVLAIFLDDLDRCRRERVLQVLEAINLFLDLPGVCFYLGLDWGRLAEILAAEFPDREDQFLEKIVQVSLELPPVSDEGVLAYMKTLVTGSSLADVLSGGDGGDLPALASELKSNHPRHVKRVLNDLSLTLSTMRNTGYLGDGKEQIPQACIVAWHLLHEALPRGVWEEARLLRANFDAFLNKWQALDEAAGDDERTKGLATEIVELHRRGSVKRYVEALASLSGTQRDRLVNFGSPPREEPRRKPDVGTAAGLADLDGRGWVHLDGGSYEMGADDLSNANPVHPVTVSPFMISRFPVTNQQYRQYLDSVKTKNPPEHWKDGAIPAGKDNHPVAYVSYADAAAFCRWLTQRIGDKNGKARLLREAEWEFAARGTDGRRFPWGDQDPTPQHANYDATGIGDTMPVGSYPVGATPEGVQDLAGNVWEWCADWFGPYSDKPETDPTGPEKGQYRVLRGGAFRDDPQGLRAAFRFGDGPDGRVGGIGFRVVWSAPGGQD